MKKAILVSLTLLLAGCAGAFLPISAPSWEKGQTYEWDVFAEGSGSVRTKEPGHAPMTIPLPPTVLLDGTVKMSILDAINETFKWYPTAVESTLTMLPDLDPYTETGKVLLALRASDIAQAPIHVQQNPFKATPGIFQGGMEFPVDSDFEYIEDLFPEEPGLIVFGMKAGTTESITTPAGTYASSSLEWRIELDTDRIEAMVMEEEELTSFSLNLDLHGTLWFSPETQWLVQSTAKFSGSFSITAEDTDGTYEASGSGNARFEMSLTSHGIEAVPTLESYYSAGDVVIYVPPVGPGTSQVDELIATELVLSHSSANAATETPTASVQSQGTAVASAFYMYDLNANLLETSGITDSWVIPVDTLGGFYVLADVVESQYADPEAVVLGIFYDGAIENGCGQIMLPTPGDCTGASFETSLGIADLSATSQSTGLHTLTLSNGNTEFSSIGVLTASATADPLIVGSWLVVGEGDLGTAVTVNLKTTLDPALSSLGQESFAPPMFPKQVPGQGMESLFEPLLQLLPEWLVQSVDLQGNEIPLDRLVFVGIPLENL